MIFHIALTQKIWLWDRQPLFKKKFFVFYKEYAKFAKQFFIMLNGKFFNDIKNTSAIIVVVIVIIIPLTFGGGITI